METTTTFDLNRAIQRWRENLAQSPAFQSENLHELEAHLRDSVTGLQSRGLSEEEAFLVATRRLGATDALGNEFGKVNVGAVWRARALWMLAGMLSITVAWDLSRAVSWSLLYLGSLTGMDGFSLGWLSAAAKSATLALIVAGFWFLATGRLQWASQRPGLLIQRPTFFIVVLLGGVLLLKLSPSALEMLSVRNLAPQMLGQAYLVVHWFDFVSVIVVALAMAVILSRLLSSRRDPKFTGRIATWPLILLVAIPMLLSSARAQTRPAGGNASPTEKRTTATVDQAMTLWQGGKKDEAIAKFMAVDFSRRPLFPTGSVLNYTEAQFVVLPQAARDKLATQMNADIRVLKEICAHVRDTAKSVPPGGGSAKSSSYTAQLKKCGDALNHPDSLALLKLVGKAIQKQAAEISAAPQN